VYLQEIDKAHVEILESDLFQLQQAFGIQPGPRCAASTAPFAQNLHAFRRCLEPFQVGEEKLASWNSAIFRQTSSGVQGRSAPPARSGTGVAEPRQEQDPALLDDDKGKAEAVGGIADQPPAGLLGAEQVFG
jgi:hypothetical protein